VIWRPSRRQDETNVVCCLWRDICLRHVRLQTTFLQCRLRVSTFNTEPAPPPPRARSHSTKIACGGDTRHKSQARHTARGTQVGKVRVGSTNGSWAQLWLHWSAVNDNTYTYTLYSAQTVWNHWSSAYTVKRYDKQDCRYRLFGSTIVNIMRPDHEA